MELQQALRVLVSAMRDEEPPQSSNTPEPQDGGPAMRPMSYFMGGKPSRPKVTTNADPDSPLVPRAVLLAPPDKKAAA